MTRLNKKMLLIPSAVAIVAVGAVVPAYADNSDATSVETLLPELAQPQDPQDEKLAEEADLEALGGIDPESVRSLGADELGSYWLGRAGSSEVCLIVQAPGDYRVTSSTCTDIARFSETGLSLRTGESADRENNPEAYLMPADVPSHEVTALSGSSEIASRRSAESGAQSGLLVVRSGDASDLLDPATLQREDGSSFEFTPLGHEE